MRRIISIVLIVCVVFSSGGCTSGLFIDDIQSNIELYKKNQSDDVLIEIIIESYCAQDYLTLQKYGDIFFLERSQSEIFKVFSEKITSYESLEHDDVSSDESAVEDAFSMYDTILWHYIFSYFYDLENDAVSPDYARINELYGKTFSLFKNNDLKFGLALVCIGQRVNAEQLKSEFLATLYKYALDCAEEQRDEILLFLGFTYGADGESELHELFMSLVSLQNSNKPYENWVNGTGNVTENNYDNLCAISSKIVSSKEFSYDTLCAEFKTEPVITCGDTDVIFKFYTHDYSVSYFGNPVFAAVVSDIDSGKIHYYKSHTLYKDEQGDETIVVEGKR